MFCIFLEDTFFNLQDSNIGSNTSQIWPKYKIDCSYYMIQCSQTKTQNLSSTTRRGYQIGQIGQIGQCLQCILRTPFSIAKTVILAAIPRKYDPNTRLTAHITWSNAQKPKLKICEVRPEGAILPPRGPPGVFSAGRLMIFSSTKSLLGTHIVISVKSLDFLCIFGV